MPHLVVEQVGGHPPGGPGPAHVLPGTPAVVTNGDQRTLERRRARDVAVRESDGQSIEQQVDRTRRPGTRRRGACGSCRGQHAGAEPAGDACRSERLEVGLARETGIERLEPPGRVEQQRHAVFGATEIERDLALEALVQGAVELIQGSVRGRREERERLLGSAGQLLDRCGPQRTPCSRGGIERERGGALEERRGRSHAAARPRPPRRALQLVGDVLVGSDGSLGEVPRTTIRIELSASVAAASARCAARRSSAVAARRSPNAGAGAGRRPAHPPRPCPPPRRG